MSEPRTRGREPLPNDELWVALFNLCEQQGRRWPDIQQAISDLTAAGTAEEVAAVLVPVLTYDPAVQVVNAAAVKDARRAVRVAQDVLARIDRGLAGSVETSIGGSRSRRRSTRYLPCPACGQDKAAQGMSNHLRGIHRWTNEQIEAWKASRVTPRNAATG